MPAQEVEDDGTLGVLPCDNSQATFADSLSCQPSDDTAHKTDKYKWTGRASSGSSASDDDMCAGGKIHRCLA